MQEIPGQSSSRWNSSYRYYQIELNIEEDSFQIDYKIEFKDEFIGDGEFKTQDLDTFLQIMKVDLLELPENNREPLFYIHGMFGNQATVLHYSKKEMKSLYQKRVKSDIARFIVVRWPAQNPIYKIDKANAHQIAPLFSPIFSKIVSELNGIGISPDVLAHSLGTEFFMKLYSSLDSNKEELDLDQILICAPDLDTHVFDKKGELRGLEAICDRITVYHSHQDMTLAISSKLNKKGRLGLDGPGEEQNDIDKLFFVDVSQIKDEEDFPLRITGHSYYRSSPIITRDMVMTLMGKPADRVEHRSQNESYPRRYTIELEKVKSASATN